MRQNGESMHENVVVASEANDHSRIAAHSCKAKVINVVIENHPYFKSYDSIDLYIWSDWCGSQFRSKFVFVLTFMFPKSFNDTKYYNE